MKTTKLKTLTILCCLLATTFVCSAQTFDENGFNTNPSATDNQYQEPTVINGVYQIANAGNLYWFADFVNQGSDNLNANAVLANDITVNENLLSYGNVINGSDFKAWTPIGTISAKYNGTFDGNGNTVSGLYFNDGTKDYVGLFGYIGSGATVQNVGVIDSYIRGYNSVGGVVGDNDGGAIINVYNAGSVSGAGGSVGGVAGFSVNGTVSNAYNTGSVSGSSYVGGVVGINLGSISNVYNTGSVSGTSGGVGGVVGINNWGSISKACNTGSVSGNYTRVGGVVGTNNGTIGNVYNTGSVSGSSKVGGVVGDNGNGGKISNVYNTGSVSGTGGGVVGQNDGTVSNGFFNTAYYSGNAIGGGTGTANTVVGMTLAELANLAIGSEDGFPLLEGETESPWAKKGISYDKATGKLTFTLPYLKNLVVPDAETILSFTVASGVIQISTAEDLKNFAELVNEYDIRDVDAELTTSITLNSNLLGENNANVDAETGEYMGNTPANVWTPIGTSSAKYTGTFDGNGHTISGLYFNNESAECVGLFGAIGEGSKVQNVGVVDSYFKGKFYVGGVVGYNDGGTVSNVYNTGAVSGETYVGGVVGYNDGGTVSNAYNTGAVSGETCVGGVVGYNYNGTVSNVYNTGAVSGKYYYVGGVVGYNDGGTVSNAYNMGSVRGSGDKVGGVVGADYGTVSNAYNMGSVNGSAVAPADIFIKNGAISTAANWSGAAVPTTTGYVVAEATVATNFNIADLHILAGAKVIVNNGATLTVTGTLTNSDAANLVIEDGGQLITSSTGVKATIEKNIAQATNGEITNWYLISSPVGTVNTSVVAVNDINLYAYNEANLAWNGYLGSNGFDNLVSGKGYLYRNSEDVTLSFTGTVATPGTVAGISLTCNNEDNKYAGFNLLGNPYSKKISSNCISLSNGATFTGVYTLGTDGGWYPSVSADIDPCEGFLVKVDKTTTATFGTPAKGTTYNNDYIQFTVANSQYEDVTYALFSKGNGLTKINHRNADIPMLYINQNDRDYAIANFSDNTKSFSLNFKAMTTGKYTLSYNTTGEYNYLHIIDRLTGADVDMLVDGEYSFIATPSDNTNRFIVRLEYMPNYSESNAEIFAFQNGNEVLVSGSGELQIFDVTGRSVMTTTINGAESIRIPAQGVYILRLVGSEIKTQKIVVR